MKIVVLIPSSEYASYAGARIRYGRIAAALEDLGADLILTDLAQFEAEQAVGDVFIFSKCHDPRALVAAAVLAGRRHLVGIDLFDDYFSGTGDSRLARYRNWLTQMLDSCSFALCSTEQLARVLGTYRRGFPVHVMNDPAADCRPQDIAQIVTAKRRRAIETMQLEVAWFGVGDNPNFPVGLSDLAAFGGMLRDLGRSGMDVRLRVLTNARALTAAGLEQLRDLPVATEVGEWTEEQERQLLAQAFLAFLPVGVQPFSIAKSLNRAVTALSAGCQVLSAGHPLYRALDPLIYREPQALLDDLSRDALRLSAARIDKFHEVIDAFASPTNEASGLVEFLGGLSAIRGTSPQLILIHGHSTNGAAHKSIQAAGGLSVASPYCTAALGFDVIFTPGRSGLDMLVSQKASERLRPELKDRTVTGTTVGGKSFLQVKDCEGQMTGSEAESRTWGDAPLPFQLATYANSMREIRDRITEAFGPCRMIISETSPLPFPVAI